MVTLNICSGSSETDRLNASDQRGWHPYCRQEAARLVARAAQEDLDAKQEEQALAKKGMKLIESFEVLKYSVLTPLMQFTREFVRGRVAEMLVFPHSYTYTHIANTHTHDGAFRTCSTAVSAPAPAAF